MLQFSIVKKNWGLLTKTRLLTRTIFTPSIVLWQRKSLLNGMKLRQITHGIHPRWNFSCLNFVKQFRQGLGGSHSWKILYRTNRQYTIAKYAGKNIAIALTSYCHDFAFNVPVAREFC